MFLEFDFEVKVLHRCGLYLFLYIQQPSSFHFLYNFPNNLHNSNFHNFSKSDKNTLSVWGNIHLHTIMSLQYLPPDVRHFPSNAVGEAGKKLVECDGIWLYLAIELAGSH